MDHHRWDPHAAVICPYDETHVLSVKRFQRHLVKCRQNHPDKDFVSCPFNAVHMFLRSELRTHLAHCVDRVTLDADVLKETDPETGEEFRLKGKTDMPRAPNIIELENDDWDDEIEENLSLKLSEQEEYLRLQSLIAKAEEEPLLRRPNFQSVPKPNLPVHNKPVFADYDNLTSLRRPNLLADEKLPVDETKRIDSEICLEERCEMINKGILPVETLNGLDPLSLSEIDNKRSDHREFDNESIASDSTWVSSIYEPIKRNTTRKNIADKKTDDFQCNTNAKPSLSKPGVVQIPPKGVTISTNIKPKPGISRGQLLRALESSLSSSSSLNISMDKSFKGDPSGTSNYVPSASHSKLNIFEPSKKGMGRGNLKLAALNFQNT